MPPATAERNAARWELMSIKRKTQNWEATRYGGEGNAYAPTNAVLNRGWEIRTTPRPCQKKTTDKPHEALEMTLLMFERTTLYTTTSNELKPAYKNVPCTGSRRAVRCRALPRSTNAQCRTPNERRLRAQRQATCPRVCARALKGKRGRNAKPSANAMRVR